MKLKSGYFDDPYRGNGYFLSCLTETASILFAVRWRWHFYVWRKPEHHKIRVYFASFEIEVARFPAVKGQ
ncbi:hypothetical protein HBA92_19730 [Ochrobactrum sp. MR28]|nr:hypothetical protein [Ochrobactrum sp. MR28]MBX8818633.1 hypothetical protein [Ochrobactrum sp. MR31]